MKKMIAAAVLAVFSAACLAGCSNGGKKDESAKALKPVKEIASDVLNCGAQFPEMVEVNEDNFRLKYSLEEGDYEEYAVWWAGSGAYADEICIIKSTDAPKVEKAVEERLESQKQAFKDYVPAEYDKLCKTEVKSKGEYVYWLCTNDNSKAESALEKDFE